MGPHGHRSWANRRLNNVGPRGIAFPVAIQGIRDSEVAHFVLQTGETFRIRDRGGHRLMDTPINPVLPDEKTISRLCQDFCPYVVVLFHSRGIRP